MTAPPVSATTGLPPTAESVIRAFTARHGVAPTVLARAPGRVNLIGEHTDYNDGFVLPAAIDRDTWVAAGPRTDGLVDALALDEEQADDRFPLSAEPPHYPGGGWRDHVRGTLAQLVPSLISIDGMNLVIAGDVPMGAGLSSSASLALALLRAAQKLAGDPELNGKQLARLAQQAENRFVGCQCGIMDQLASAEGRPEHALLIDCRSLDTRAVPLPEGTTLLIAHSRVKRGLVDSAYNERRAQCEQAARALGVPALRDATLDMLNAAQLPDKVFRRARHIITENERVLAATEALRQGDLPRLGELMAASHASMRDDFEITTPAVDQLAAVLQQVAGQDGGARMTGGGFGGCCIALLKKELVPKALEALEAGYRSPEGLPALVYLCEAGPGARADAWTDGTPARNAASA
ncbi:galactokinase [Roseateles amylovorans]|uniref:Galactokinase n=1 Tax=Roseateles amylovorans TaxID=2978473 RepID=A0ABY6B5Z0_9BURK|nr:galactokinase [Roseateles amylovorans]UXH80590.1 galactokinase [Roseateles amylovorans]